MASIKLKPTDFYNENSKYRIYLEGMLRDGYSMEDIADKLGVNRKTLYNWMNKDSTFYSIVRDAREIVNYEIESALKRSCKGFYVDKDVVDKNGVVHTIQEFIPPSVEAQKFWLKNKAKDKWKDRVEQEVHTNVEDLSSLAKMLEIDETEIDEIETDIIESDGS